MGFNNLVKKSLLYFKKPLEHFLKFKCMAYTEGREVAVGDWVQRGINHALKLQNLHLPGLLPGP